MFIPKKKFKALEKRIADLEAKVQGQQEVEYVTEITPDGKLHRAVVGKSVLELDDDAIRLKGKAVVIVH